MGNSLHLLQSIYLMTAYTCLSLMHMYFSIAGWAIGIWFWYISWGFRSPNFGPHLLYGNCEKSW